MQLGNAQYIALDALSQQLEQVVPDKITDISVLQESGKALKSLKQQLDVIVPDNETVATLKNKLLEKHQHSLVGLKKKAVELTDVA